MTVTFRELDGKTAMTVASGGWRRFRATQLAGANWAWSRSKDWLHAALYSTNRYLPGTPRAGARSEMH
jgi:hypothetical protein